MSNTETPKTESKKTETKAAPTGAAQTPANPFAAFTAWDPMAYWAQSQQMFRDMMTDAINVAQTGANTMADRYSALDPMGYWASFRQAMSTAQQHGSSVAGKLDAQYVELESQLVERAHAAVATWAQLANDSIAYSAKLSAEARKLGADVAKKMGATA
jgi:hypothetical protein